MCYSRTVAQTVNIALTSANSVDFWAKFYSAYFEDYKSLFLDIVELEHSSQVVTKQYCFG